ncbi:MAG: twin-arginine translocase subunit TatC [Spirochaetae bacterium HGW-Spirochaetae-7]|jgi:sec-independent protein translocase protein TatC|nr:MAG: twin-arginine translocase subunit TatC [Spirochaetae bacterium HGW-Spirochaetae-7]
MATAKNPGKMMPFIGHVRELRSCIIGSLVVYVACAIGAFVFSDSIIGLFTRQFNIVSSSVESSLVVTTIVEGFTAQIKISAIAGFIISLPVHLFNLLRFIFPGMAKKNRRIILIFLLLSFCLIVFGAYVAYFKVVPLAIGFLTNPYFVPDGVGYLLSYQANIFYVFSFILWSLAALQLPLVLEILLMLNLLNRKAVFRASRFIIVGIFLISAIVTPPDFISQIGLALPLTALYLLAILIAKIFKFGEA